MRRGAAACLLALLATQASAVECRLALALALDVSRSVDAREDRLQRQGLAAALLAPEVVRAALSTPQPVALAAYEWSGPTDQHLLVDWVLIRSRADLESAAARIAASQRATTEAPTAMGHALAYGAALLARGPDCLFHTIDLSGDGENNEGFGPRAAYATPAFNGITVNGLAINGAEYETEIQLIPYFETEVLHGPGAFLEVAQGFADFERAMRRKLERELSGLVIGGLR
ncbi:DUF1194 domain-containing protein [Ruegeria pomeroyi]|uniref:DUF1194 domain-containing protein n=1 Tax=Ruegeria pomeroyi TaxID=89184 RepID=UPI001F3F0325|nr:DUF1194 domain-containing protein [Ruegeria pomeroyi]MCE8510305.1 DUF1194 domain-containing protein [Ruegeria pomeroyi]